MFTFSITSIKIVLSYKLGDIPVLKLQLISFVMTTLSFIKTESNVNDHKEGKSDH